MPYSIQVNYSENRDALVCSGPSPSVHIRLTRRQDCVTRHTLLPRIVPYSSTLTGIYSAWSPPSLAPPMRLSLFQAPVRIDQSQPNDVMNTFRNGIALTRTYRRNASVMLASLVLCRHLAGVHGACGDFRFSRIADMIFLPTQHFNPPNPPIYVSCSRLNHFVQPALSAQTSILPSTHR